MKTDRFLKRIWLANGLIILLGSIALISFLTYQFTKDLFRDDIVQQQTLDLADDTKDEEKWSLGYPDKINGSKYYMLPLQSENKIVEEKTKVYGLYSSDYSITRSKNVLFINSESNESHWLFDTVQQLIIDIEKLELEIQNRETITKAIYYIVINHDTNNDEIYDLSDKRVFALSKPDGTNYSEILIGFDSIVAVSINDSGNLFLIYINNDKVHSMLVDLSNFNIINKKLLPRVSAS